MKWIERMSMEWACDGKHKRGWVIWMLYLYVKGLSSDIDL